LNIDPFAFSKTFVVVQEMFLTETAAIANVVLPAANAYEKSGPAPTPVAICNWSIRPVKFPEPT